MTEYDLTNISGTQPRKNMMTIGKVDTSDLMMIITYDMQLYIIWDENVVSKNYIVLIRVCNSVLLTPRNPMPQWSNSARIWRQPEGSRGTSCLILMPTNKPRSVTTNRQRFILFVIVLLNTCWYRAITFYIDCWIHIDVARFVLITNACIKMLPIYLT